VSFNVVSAVLKRDVGGNIMELKIREQPARMKDRTATAERGSGFEIRAIRWSV
jgi:hypothetical protein